MAPRKDLSKTKYGLLTPFEYIPQIGKTHSKWLCKCDCGNIISVYTNNLTSKLKDSCGCYKPYPTKNWKGFQEISGTYWNDIKCNAKARNIEFCISLEYIWNLYIKQNKLCYLSGEPIKFARTQKDFHSLQTASLDRIDSSKGYIEGNVQWVHKDINIMKWSNSNEKFIEWCKKCLNTHNSRKRPNWDEYFLEIAKTVSRRSEDNFVKYGAVLINEKTKYIKSTGYNALIPGADETLVNRWDRDARRDYMQHAEKNAILNSGINGKEHGPLTMYISGQFCFPCLQDMLSFGVSKIVYQKSTKFTAQDEQEPKIENLLNKSKIEVVVYDDRYNITTRN